MKGIDLLARLSDCPGVSGGEDAVRDLLWEHLRDKVDVGYTDTMGNLYVGRGVNRPGPRVMLTAHMDEVGLMITHIEKEGLLRFAPVGGLDARILPGRDVLVGDQQLPGVIGCKPIHLSSPEERQQVPKMQDLYIDLGVSDKESAEKLVKPGDRVTFATRAETFGEGLFKGKALDNRVGCALLVEALQMDSPFPLWGAFTAQEEVGLRGAKVAAYHLKPHLALVLEGTTCSDTPGTEEHQQSTRLGGGPAFSFMDATLLPNKTMVRALIAAAEEAGVPWQWKQTTLGGTDGGTIHQAREGVPTAVVSVPCRYIHGPASVLSLADLEATRRTLEVFLARLDTLWNRIREERGISA